MKAMILCAGEGTRLRPLTLTTPKPAIPFLEVPLAAYSLALLEDLNINEIVVNTYHLPDQIVQLFKNLKDSKTQLSFTHEESLLGSGGGIHNAQKYLQSSKNFVVTNGDEVILPHQPALLSEMLKFHEWHKGLATLLTLENPEVGTKFGGAWVSGELNKVNSFSKTPVAGFKGLHFIGVMIFKNKIFDYFKEPLQVENILYETLTQAMSQGEEVYCYNCQAEWFETGNIVDLNQAQQKCKEALGDTQASGNYWTQFLQQVISRYRVAANNPSKN